MMVDKYEYVTEQLKKSCSRVSFKRAKDNDTFPYVVYNLPSTSEVVANRDDIILEIDIWDIQRDGYDVISSIENLTDTIDKSLKDIRYLDGKHLLMFQRLNRLVLPDEDKNIERRQLRYLIKSYDKN